MPSTVSAHILNKNRFMTKINKGELTVIRKVKPKELTSQGTFPSCSFGDGP